MVSRFVGTLAVCLLAFGLAPTEAVADDLDDDPPFIALGVGLFEVFKSEDRAADFRLEYKHSRLWFFKPWVGFEATSKGATYVVGGVLFDIYFGRRIVITPSFGAGWWRNGGGKDLGNNVQFRTQLEVAYRFNDRSRIGVALSHISNASLSSDNPGVEILNLYYSIPLNKIFPPSP